jgi:hypothetical protein
VLLGRNNSGKSALARLPLLLATGYSSDAKAPLDIDGTGIDIAGSFTDLIFSQRPHGSITLSADLGREHGPNVSTSAAIQHIDEFQTQLVSRFSLTDGRRHVQVDWIPGDPRAPRWSISCDGSPPKPGKISFRGLLPTILPTEDEPTDSPVRADAAYAVALVEQARQAFPRIRYVGPFRERPQRFYRLPARSPESVGTVGEDAPHILADDVSRGDGQLLRSIDGFLSREVPGWRVDIDLSRNLYSIVLTSTEDARVQVNLADTGTGIAQVLPILVQRALDQARPPQDDVLEIIEQPELHLHPAAHAALADLYLGGLSAGRCRFLIETHSETFVLRLRRRIAEGSLNPNDLALYFVDRAGVSAQVRRLHVDELGNVEDWPAGIFSEDYQEVRALTRAQRNRTSE